MGAPKPGVWVVGGLLACAPPSGGPAVGGSTSGAGSTSTDPGIPAMSTSNSGDADSMGPGPHPACADYVMCLQDAQSPQLRNARQQYGPQSPCWTDATAAAACAMQCTQALDGCMQGSSGGTGEPPPACSLSEVAPGASSPVVMGAQAGVLPTEIGTILEAYCGCHLVQDNAQLVRLTPEYNGLIRFTTLQQMREPFEGAPTYTEIERRSITQQNMPPVYHCETADFGSLPAAPYQTLAQWIAAGAPDGAQWPR